jgi:thiol:disulfide interchange protein DsbD
MRRFGLVPLLVLLSLSFSYGWDGGPTLGLKVIGPAEPFKPGVERTVFIEITIYPPFHINSHLPSDEFLVPTTIAFKTQEGVKVVKVEYPAGELKKFIFSESPLSVYEGTARITATFAVAPDFSGPEVRVEGSLSFQACDNESCLAPDEMGFVERYPLAEVPAPAKTGVSPAPAGVSPKPSVPSSAAPVEPKAKTLSATKEQEAPPTKGSGEAVPLKPQGLEGKGLLLSFLLVFLGGLALNLTPCIYPLIPITISYFGGQAGGKRGSLLGHALFYVLGMALTYSFLGVLASFTGSLFGSALQHPPVLIVIAAIMVALALSMFDLYEIRMPSFLSNMAGTSRRGLFGTLFMGLTVGIVAAPCIGPFVLGLLTYVGDRGNVLLGFALFFVLALGLGLPFVFLAVFSGSISRLPRSGSWMVWVRKIFGFILLAMAVYFLQPLFPDPLAYSLTLALVLLVAGVYMAWIEPTRTQGKVFPVIRTLVGVVFFVLALVTATSGIRVQIERTVARSAAAQSVVPGIIRWSAYDSDKIGQAVLEGKPVFIDFYADWCIPCKELDKNTFADPEVVQAAGRFLMLKADLTSSSAPLSRELTRKYKIRGVPTLVFLDAEGNELTDLRVVGFVDKAELLKRMKAALEKK